MPKLCQITALLTGKKTLVEKAMTEVYHKLQKPALFLGLTKRYTPGDEDGDTFPDEKQNIQVKVEEALQEIRDAQTTLIDLTATQDQTNSLARADVMVDGKVIMTQVPVTHLLFLEKQLLNLRAVLTAIPTLDPQETWHYDANAACFVSDPTETNKTKKTPRNHIKYEATEQHPAQVEMYYEDVIIGKWKTLKYSGAMPADQKNAILARLQKLQDAVKMAREEANSIDAKDAKYGDKVFDFVLGGK
jgi:hypothetical protein